MEEKVTINSNGYELKGNIHFPEEKSPTIVMLHGFTANKDLKFWRDITNGFVEEDFTCLRFNFRGCGEGREKSQGKFENTTLTSRIEDYRSVIDFLKNFDRVNSNRVGAFGHSLGGMVAISGNLNGINAIVTLGTPFKIPRFDEPQLPQKVGEYYKMPSGEKFKTHFYEDMKKYDIGLEIKNSPPIRVIQGEADEVIPINHAKELYENANEPKSLNVVPEADHLFSNTKSLNRAIDLSVKWFKKYV